MNTRKLELESFSFIFMRIKLFIKHYFSSVSNGTHATLIVLFLLAVSLPITLLASNQQQQIKQEAAPMTQACGLTNTSLCPVGYECNINGSIPDTGGTCVPIPKPKPICLSGSADILFVLDISDSMHGKSGSQTKMAAAVTAMNNFIDLISIDKSSKAGLVTFGRAATLDQKLTKNYSMLKSVVKKAAGHLEYRTCTQCGIDVAKGEEIQDAASENNKVAIVITDGEANWTELMQPPQALDTSQGKQAALQAAINAYKTSAMTFFTVGVGTPGKNANFNSLKKIAADTGGAFFYAPTADQLTGIFQQVSNAIKQNAKASSSINQPVCGPIPSCIPKPPQCYPGSKLGIMCPAEPRGGWCPSTSTSPAPSCMPRPKCLDATPRCMIAEPVGGWCPPQPKPTCTPKPICKPGTMCPAIMLPKGGWWCGSVPTN